MNTSPIIYMGNKSKLVKKGLTNFFPKDISTMYDLFCGTGTVSINTDAKAYVLNDKNKNLIDLINMFYWNDPEELISRIDKLIDEYQLPTFSTDIRSHIKSNRVFFNQNYIKLRNDFNETRKPELLYMLNIFAFSHLFRFNSKNNFNAPFGNGYFTDEMKDNIRSKPYARTDDLQNKDFREFVNTNFAADDFVYFDPPYSFTTASYNENNAWTEKDDQDLFNFCDLLNSKHIRFAMSNCFENRGKSNTRLIEWSKKYNKFMFDDFSYCPCGKGSSKTTEVLITNY